MHAALAFPGLSAGVGVEEEEDEEEDSELKDIAQKISALAMSDSEDDAFLKGNNNLLTLLLPLP